MSNSDYHSQPAISKSGLDLIHRAPALFKYRRENPLEQTQAMRMGTLVHTAVLEPHDLANLVIAPKCDRRTAAGKAEWAAFEAESSGREIVSAFEFETVHAISEAVHEHDAASQALGMLAEVETSIFWTDEITDVECRCRPDGILTNDLIIDVKTTRGADPESFAKSIAQYRYHVQAAYYMDGFESATGRKPRGFMFIAVETEPPYLVACYVASEAMILRGRDAYQRDLQTYRECIDTDTWPGLSAIPTIIDLPRWA